MANIFNIEPNAHQSKNKFDVSFSSLMSSPLGLLLPAYQETVKRGDSVKLSMSSFIRSNVVNSAAYQSFVQNVDFYFVPYRLLWSDFNNWRNTVPNPLTTRDNYISPNLRSGNTVDQYLLPHTTWSSLARYLYGRILTGLDFYEYATNGTTAMFSDNGVFFDNAFYGDVLSVNYCLRLLDLFNYSTPIDIGNVNGNWLSRDYASESLTARFFRLSENGYPTVDNVVNIPINSTAASGLVNQPHLNIEASPSGIIRERAWFLFSYYNNLGFTTHTQFNYFKLAAFNCIYQHYYRNDHYEVFDPSTFNVDNLFGTGPNYESENSYIQGINPYSDTSFFSSGIHAYAATLSDAIYSRPTHLSTLEYIPCLSIVPGVRNSIAGYSLYSSYFSCYFSTSVPTESIVNPPSYPSNTFEPTLSDQAIAFTSIAARTPYADGTHTSVSPDTRVDHQLNFTKLFTPHYKNFGQDKFTSLRPTNLLDASFSTISPLVNPSSGNARQLTGYGTTLEAATNVYPGLLNSDSAGYKSTIGVDNGTSQVDLTSTAIHSISSHGGGQITGSNGNNAPNSTFTSWGQSEVDYLRSAFNGSSAATVLRNLGESVVLTANDIRGVLARDRFARSLVYSHKDYASLVKALFGETVDNVNQPLYLGHYTNSLDINTITATSDGSSSSGESSVGELYGRVASANDKDTIFTKEFSEDGIIIGVQYIAPKNNYDSNRLSRDNTYLSRFDFYYPHFDNLGLVPLYQWERALGWSNVYKTPITNAFLSDGTDSAQAGVDYRTFAYNSAGNFIGFSNRFPEFKSRENEVHGIFQTNQTMDFWTFTNNQNDLNFSSSNNILRSMLPSKALYKILPHLSDRIFGVAYDGSPDTDPFYIYNDFSVSRISDISEHGVANF